jgi:acyl transferase domain-containing protein/NAD(P)-dependent dehydrogenase (short-subunit alcohol dehydrogenase family)/acyl carrier protein
LDSPLAIIGIGCLFPKAEGPGAYWANIKNKVDGIGPIPPSHWNPADYFDTDPKKPDFTYAQRGGFLEPVAFNPAEWGIAPNDLEATDTSQLLALVAAQMALRDAGLLKSPPAAAGGLTCDKRKVSVILGVTGTLEMVVPLGARLGHPIWRKALKDAGVSDTIADEVVRRIGDGYVGWQENSFPGLLGNVVAGRVANRLDLGGTNCVVDAACASSLSALHLAGMELQTGRADVVVTGGVDTFNDIFMYMCFSKTPALSPTGDAKPFDAHGDGTILGEGLGVVVLKRLTDAERDGDRVYAVVKGIGTSSDGKGNAVYAPSSAGQVEALREAYRQAGVTPDTIELVEAHGTGTRVGDAAEVEALTTVFRDALKKREPWCALGSVKSQIGHTKAAAGAAGLIKAALALHYKVLPPTIKVTKPLDPLASGTTPFYVNTEPRPWLARDRHPRRAGVSAFGFGGSNFHCVLEEHAGSKPAPDWDGDTQIVALSGATVAELKQQLGEWMGSGVARPESSKGVVVRDATPFEDSGRATQTGWQTTRARAAEARAKFNPAAPHRLLFVLARDKGSPVARTRHLLATNAGQSTWHSPDGIAYGSGPPGKLGFLFPGQGAQSVGMLRDLACTFPAVQDVLTEADRAFAASMVDPGDKRLSDFIYPHPAFSADARATQEEALRATWVAQPALGAVSLGALQVLAHFGLKPAATAGHSYGELTALCAAGCFDAPSLFELSQLRGRLMAETREDAGAMLAVQAPLDTVEDLLARDNYDLVIANKNGPAQAVLSGRTCEIERAAVALKERQVRHVRLPVAAAFHSPLVAAAAGPFRAALEPIAFQTAQLPVFANSTAREYPRDPQAVRDLLAGQLARPVEFVDQIRNMAAAGVRTFVEVGPGSTLTKLVESILDNTPHAAVAIDASAGKRAGILDLAHVLVRLAALGHPVRLTAWDEGAPPAPLAPSKPTLTVPICGANYRKPAKKLPHPPAPSPKMGEGEKTLESSPPSPILGDGVPAQRVARGGEGKPQSLPIRHLAPPRMDPPMADPALTHALQVTQDSLAAFQRMQEQTAQLHRQFLETQESAQRTLQVLVDGQQRLLAASLGMPVAAPSVPAPLAPRTVEVTAPRIQHTPSPQISAQPPKPVPAAIPAAPSVRAGSVSDGSGSPSLTLPARTNDLNRVLSVLLAVVAEKTGYPSEMLNPDMGLDADLGIDSIKRVEILSALQEQLPDAPLVKPEHLGTLQTLRQIAEFLCTSEPSVRAGSVSDGKPEPLLTLPARTVKPTSIAHASGSVAINHVLPVLLAIVADKTGYPPEMLNPDMGLDADLGIDSIKRVEILSALQEQLPDAPLVKPEHLGTLQTLRQIAEFLCASEPSVQAGSVSDGKPEPSLTLPARTETEELDRRVLRVVPLTGDRPPVTLAAGAKVWLVGDDGPIAKQLAHRGLHVRVINWSDAPPQSSGPIAGLILVAPSEAEQLAIRAFRWLRAAGPALRQSPASIVATVTHLDGAFGLSRSGPRGDAEIGALAGLVKTARHEWPTIAAKAIDVDPTLEATAAADAIVDELFLAGPTEVGIGVTGRVTLELSPAPLAKSVTTTFGPTDVVVLSGGARGVTAEVAVALAAGGPTLVLLGRSPEPATEPSALAACADEPAIKRALAATTTGATPRQVAERCAAILAGREVRHTLDRLAAAGAKALYRSVDVRDAAAVAGVLAEVRQNAGPITGVVHGAGVLADRKIDDQTDEQFDAVYATKVSGLKALLAATATDPLKLVAVFSSSTGRFGRSGQVAYAAANEAVNKLSQAEARRRPECRVVAVNWGPWEGGMVTPALRGVFAAEGIGLIPLAAGARHLLAEIAAADRAVETVVLGPGSELPEQAQPRRRGGEDTLLPATSERDLSLETHPVLAAHVIDSRAVLPMALTVEWLAHAALHGNPGLAFHGLDDLRIFHPVTIQPGRATPISVHAGKAVRRDGQSRVMAEVRGRRPDGREVVHSRAEVILVSDLPTAPAAGSALALPRYPLDPDDVYQRILFHGPELRGLEQIVGCGADGIVVIAQTAPAPAAWVQQPQRATWLADPLVLDCAFQAMSVWCHAERGAVSLPSTVGRYRQYVRRFPTGTMRVICRVAPTNGPVVRAAIEFVADNDKLIARIDGFECVLDPALTAAFRRNRLERATV